MAETDDTTSIPDFTLNHDPNTMALTLDAIYNTAEDAVSFWDVTRYDTRKSEFLLYYPLDHEGHKDRRPHWWLQRIKLDLPLNHYLFCLNNVPEVTELRDDKQCWKEFLDFLVPVPVEGHRASAQQKEFDRLQKLRDEHKSWCFLDIVLMHVVYSLTLKGKGRPTGAPSQTPIEIFGGRQVNTADDMQLRVSHHFPLYRHLFEKSRIRLFSSFSECTNPLTSRKPLGS